MKTSLILLKIIFCLILTIFFISNIFVQLMVVKLSFEVAIIEILSVIMIISTWFLAFYKAKYLNIFTKGATFILLFLLYLHLPLQMPNVKKAWDIDMCLDSGYCKENITKMKTKEGIIVPVTRENCINNNYKWVKEDKSCNLRENIK